MADWNIKLERSGDFLVSTRTQYARPAILDTLAEMRKAEPMADRPGLGRWALSVPFEDWLRLRERYPDLASKDTRARTRAWQRLMQSPEGAMYRVRDRI